MSAPESTAAQVNAEILSLDSVASAWRAYSWMLVMVFLGCSAIALLVVADAFDSSMLETASFFPFYLMPSAFLMTLWHGVATARTRASSLARWLRTAGVRNWDVYTALLLLAAVVGARTVGEANEWPERRTDETRLHRLGGRGLDAQGEHAARGKSGRGARAVKSSVYGR